MFYARLLVIASNTLLAVILWRAVTTGMLRVYSPFYIYIAFVSAASLVQQVLLSIWGLGSPQYYYAYYLPTLLMPLFQMWVLWDVSRRIVGNPKIAWNRLTWPSILVLSMILLAATRVHMIPEADWFHRFHAVTLPVQVIVLLFVYGGLNSLPSACLGRNVSGILLGLSIIAGVQTINFTSFLFLGTSFRAFGFLLQFAFFLALSVFSYSLWEYRPLRKLKPASQAQIAEANEKLQRVVKSLLIPK